MCTLNSYSTSNKELLESHSKWSTESLPHRAFYWADRQSRQNGRLDYSSKFRRRRISSQVTRDHTEVCKRQIPFLLFLFRVDPFSHSRNDGMHLYWIPNFRRTSFPAVQEEGRQCFLYQMFELREAGFVVFLSSFDSPSAVAHGDSLSQSRIGGALLQAFICKIPNDDRLM